MRVWKHYTVELEFTTPFAAALPRTRREIAAMLEHRMPASPPEDAVPTEELVEQVARAVAADTEPERNWATFPRDDGGIYYEARCVRAHLKDCASQVAGVLGLRGLKAQVSNRVYVEPQRLRLRRPDGSPISGPDGTEERMIHVLTRLGPRNDIKHIDYVAPPSRLGFTLKVVNDGVVTEAILRAMFEYGGVHGMGQERSQQWGQYRVVEFREAG